jgi:hypothetical protein
MIHVRIFVLFTPYVLLWTSRRHRSEGDRLKNSASGCWHYYFRTKIQLQRHLQGPNQPNLTSFKNLSGLLVKYPCDFFGF